MDQEIFLSIITVSFNSEYTIRRTIESVNNQNFKNYEHIIIDGASTDGTVAIIKDAASIYPNIRWVSEPDSGIYNAMNKGILLAKGKYIWLVNSDDWIELDSFQKIYDKVSEVEGLPIVCGWMRLVDTNGVIKTTIKADEYTLQNGINKLKLGIPHPATVVPHHIYNTIGLFDEDYYITSDVDFILRAYYSNASFCFVDCVLSNMQNTGISNQLPFKKYYHDWKIRYKKYARSLFQYYKLLGESILVLVIRKILPSDMFYKLIQFKNQILK